MTVRELREQLADLPDDMLVKVFEAERFDPEAVTPWAIVEDGELILSSDSEPEEEFRGRYVP